MKNWVTSLVKKKTLFYSEHFSIKKEEKNYTHYQCFSIATSVSQLQHLISEDLQLLLIGNETQDNYNFNTDGMQIHSIITLQLGPKLNGPLITVHFFFFFKQDHSEHVHGIMKERNKLKTLSVLVFATKQRSWEPRWASKSGRAPQKTAAEPFINMPSISLHPQDRQPGGHTAQGVHICTYTHTHTRSHDPGYIRQSRTVCACCARFMALMQPTVVWIDISIQLHEYVLRGWRSWGPCFNLVDTCQLYNLLLSHGGGA